MSVHSEKSTWLIFLVMCLPLLGVASEETQMEQTTVNTTNSAEPMTNSTKDLFASETADPKKVDIVKQIRRLNEDGSYTVGYEADDGTFKIESRDVLGNIKGTFGYVDPNGEIKRVSYSTSNTSQSSLLSSIAPPLVRLNRTSSSTTRRPQPTLIYPKTSSIPTKQTVIQAIPRRRPVISLSGVPAITTTESYRVVAGNTQSTNASESINNRQPNLKTFPIFTQRQVSVSTEPNDESNLKEFKEIEKLPVTSNSTQSTSTLPTYVRPSLVFEKIPEISKDTKPVRANTFRRQLSSNNYENRQMYAFQQSAGDDTTDVYGGSISLGTPRPLFTTTNRPRLIPIQISPRQKLNEKLATNSPQVHEEQQETTLEATTNKVEDENYVTTNPIPVYQFPNPQDQRVIERPYLRPHHQQVPIAQFRTRDFLRDNPGAAVPIGNQRVLFRYNPNIPTDENGQFVRQQIQSQVQPNIAQLGPRAQHQNIENPAEVNQDNKDNLIAIPIFNGNVPTMRYPMYNAFNDGREENMIPQRPPPLPVPQHLNEIRPISTPVSTRDLKILLHHLLIKQNRLQALIDIREDLNNHGQYNPQYQQGQQQPQQLFNPEYQQQKALYRPRSAYPQEQRYQEPRPYGAFPQQGVYNQYQGPYPNQQNQYPNRNNDYRSQDETYRNEISNFDPSVPYESQRFVPRRQRFYNSRVYEQRFEDTPNGIESSDQVEYLPPDVREALLLKMLMLAINPDFSQMQQESQTMMTTPVPEYRKKVRNVQIIGEETQTKEATKREKRMM